MCIRDSVRRGLLPTPTGTGRGKHYTQAHLETLRHIRDWQAEGFSLAAIERKLQGEPDPTPVTSTPDAAPTDTSTWFRVTLSPDVEIMLRHPPSTLDANDYPRLITLFRECLTLVEPTPTTLDEDD